MVALRGPDLRALPHWELSSDCCEILTAAAYCLNMRPSARPSLHPSCSSQLVWSGVFSQTELLTFILFWTVRVDLFDLIILLWPSHTCWCSATPLLLLLPTVLRGAASARQRMHLRTCSTTGCAEHCTRLSCLPTHLVATRR